MIKKWLPFIGILVFFIMINVFISFQISNKRTKVTDLKKQVSDLEIETSILKSEIDLIISNADYSEKFENVLPEVFSWSKLLNKLDKIELLSSIDSTMSIEDIEEFSEPLKELDSHIKMKEIDMRFEIVNREYSKVATFINLLKEEIQLFRINSFEITTKNLDNLYVQIIFEVFYYQEEI